MIPNRSPIYIKFFGRHIYIKLRTYVVHHFGKVTLTRMEERWFVKIQMGENIWNCYCAVLNQHNTHTPTQKYKCPVHFVQWLFLKVTDGSVMKPVSNFQLHKSQLFSLSSAYWDIAVGFLPLQYGWWNSESQVYV